MAYSPSRIVSAAMDMIKLKEIGRPLPTIWSDLTAEPVWQYQELPPVLLPQLRHLNRRDADDSELPRAEWFWLRRSKSTFCEGRTALVLEGLCLLLFLTTALVGSSEISISELAIEAIIVLFAVVSELGRSCTRSSWCNGDGNRSEASIASFGRSIEGHKDGRLAHTTRSQNCQNNESRAWTRNSKNRA